MIKKIHPFIKMILGIVSLLIILVITPWLYTFWEYRELATTVDYANFGTYVGGILTPLCTFASAVVIGFQIVRTTQNQKLERSLSEYNRNLLLFSQEVTDSKLDLIKKEYGNLKKTWGRDSIKIDTIKWYISDFTALLSVYTILTTNLKQLKEIDRLQYATSKEALLTLVTVEDLGMIEVVHFIFIDYREDIDIDSYDWIFLEGKNYLKQLRQFRGDETKLRQSQRAYKTSLAEGVVGWTDQAVQKINTTTLKTKLNLNNDEKL